eukprot:Clim_evm2s2 gene=Clim_evmTU2s2
MGKPKGINSKAAEARERKADQKRAAEEAKSKAQEDAKWRITDEKELQARQRVADKERKAEEKRLRDQEKKDLAAAEDAEMSKISKSGGMRNAAKRGQAAKKNKVNQASIMAFLNDNLDHKKKTKSKSDPTVVAEEDHAAAIMEKGNVNKQLADFEAEGGVLATGVDQAIGALGGSMEGLDLHPEKRMKAAYKAYEEKWLPILRKENPSLRLTQIKEMLWKQWQKAPENPKVQAAMAEAAGSGSSKVKK